MGSKYASPPVSFRDVAAALPLLPFPLQWRVALYPRPQNTTSLSPCVELVCVLRNGSTIVFKRWGGAGRATAPLEILGALLIAAQQAHNYVGECDPEDLAKRIAWDMGLPIEA